MTRENEKKGVNVLVVDDDPLVRDMIAMILEDGGYAVDTAENGAGALAKFKSGSGIGLIVSDMNMPELDGLGLIKAVRETGSDVPIIILTGNSEIATAINALNHGANDYLLKDENIQETISISAAKVLEKYELKKQNQQLMADLAEKNDRLEKEKVLAQKVQKNILPRQLNFPGLEIGSCYQPSDKIGGDFFDAWKTGQFVHFVIGDVSGHSTSSALVMAVAKGMLQSLGNTLHDPLAIVRTANRMLCESLSDSGMFLTVVYAVLDQEKNELRIVSAGHNPVFLVNNGAIRSSDSTGPVLGWDPEDTWTVANFPFKRGDTLFLYTDGLTEAKNNASEDFGEKRVQDILEKFTSPGEMVENMLKQVNGFCSGNFPDDLTMLVATKQ